MTAFGYVCIAVFCAHMIAVILATIMQDHPACKKEDAMDAGTQGIGIKVVSVCPPSLHRELTQLAKEHTNGDVGRMLVLVALWSMLHDTDAIREFQEQLKGFGD